jgi:miniconductance mechanosensitive channel
MNIEIKQWFLSNLTTSNSYASALLVVMYLIIILVIWWVCLRLLQSYIPKLTAKTETMWDDIIFNQRVIKAFATLIPALLVHLLIPQLFIESSPILPLLITTADIIIVFVSVWILTSFFNSINEILSEKDQYKGKPIGSLTQLAKILTYCIGGILIISLLIDKSPAFLLSGLGAIAAILLLVFKDSILGFVASIQLSANKMVQVGDWVTVPNYGADGDVFEINLTSIKVRNFDLTITTVPTYAFISDSFTNWRGMQYSSGRRIKRSINIKKDTICFCDEAMLAKFQKIALISDYITTQKQVIDDYNFKNKIDTSILINGRNMTNIGVFKVYIENYLLNNPDINQSMMIMVRQLVPSDTGLPLEVYAFCNNKEWKMYESNVADIFDHILSVVHYFDLELFENPSGSDFRNLINK